MGKFMKKVIQLLTEKEFSAGLDMATTISVIGVALTYIFTNIREFRCLYITAYRVFHYPCKSYI